ncbi:unnamed protein product [Polarella glacialis]|uniref:protein-L-isoaspartate(D-aspartate) O-methyltransferase n=1 Tax=Polarella glacialis TaxID=89957 RepID=A0A813G811_POLGL|nr:unnamed protein product [Polarella glacialis]
MAHKYNGLPDQKKQTVCCSDGPLGPTGYAVGTLLLLMFGTLAVIYWPRGPRVQVAEKGGFLSLITLDGQNALSEAFCKNSPLSCSQVPGCVVLRVQAQAQHAYSYMSFVTWLHRSGGAYSKGKGCSDPLGPEFDADYTIRSAPERFRLLLGKEAQHYSDDELPMATGLQWPTQTFRSINRALFYTPILTAMESKSEVPWWSTTSPAGALTCAMLLREPLRQLAEEGRSAVVADAGSGSGFFLAMLALMTAPNTAVVGIEYDMDMAKQSFTFFQENVPFDLQSLDVNRTASERFAASAARKVHVYQGDAVKMTLNALPTCSQSSPSPFGCGSGSTNVPQEAFDVLNVGFRLFPPFPAALLQTVRTGGYMLIPTCFAKEDKEYCQERLTLYRKQADGQVIEVQRVNASVLSPKVEGKFVYLFNLAERGAILGPLFNGDWKAANVLPHVQKVVSAMKASGVKKFAVAGFCYGAWVGMYLARTMSADELVCCVTPHPSITIEGMVGGDPCALASESCCPWAMYPCGDPAAGGDKETYDREGDLFKALDTKFPGKIETKRFGKMQHGFVLRGAIKEGQLGGSGDDVKAAIQECVEDMTKFFEKHGLTPAKL